MEGLLAPLIDLEGGVAAPPVDDFRERLVDRYLNAVSPAAKAKGGRGGSRGGGGGGSRKTSTGYRSLTGGSGSCKLGLGDEWVERAAGVSVTRDELAELLNLKKGGGLCARLFQLFDVHDEGRISLLEFVQTCPLLCPLTTVERKLRFMFRLYNKLDDGKLLRSEVLDLMREGLEENRLKLKVPPEKVVDEVVAIVTSSRSRPRTRKRTTRTPTGEEEEFLYWKEFRRLIEIQHEGSSFAQPAHKTTSVALLTKSNAYWTKETDFNVFLASQKDVSARELNREKTLRLIQGNSQDFDDEEEAEEVVLTKVRVAPPRALKVSMRVGDDELDDFVDQSTGPSRGGKKAVRFAHSDDELEPEGEAEARSPKAAKKKGKQVSEGEAGGRELSINDGDAEDSEGYAKSIAPFEDHLEKRWKAMSEHWRGVLTSSMGAAPSYLDAIGALQGHDSTFIVEERNKNLTVAGGALLKGELVSDEGEENALNADLQPSVHWDQNAYDILVKQEGLRKQHSCRWFTKKLQNMFRYKRQMFWLSVYFGLNFFLLAFYFLYQRFYAPQYKLLGYSICVSRSTALVMEWNSFLLLMTVCRNVITWLRSGLLHRTFPYDNNIEFHKIIACVIFISAIAHTVGHGFNVYQISHASSAEELNNARGQYRWFDFKEVPPVGKLLQSVPVLTGIALWLVLCLIFITAFYKIRQKKFEVFWYTHHLFVVYYVLFAGHGMQMVLGDFPMAWCFVIIPCILYGFERISRAVRARRDTRVVNAQIWPTKVLNLVLRRPREFDYRAGQYAFIRIPSISNFQYHPFTLTSSPEEHTISFHIRAVGDWTTKVYNKLNFELSALQRFEDQSIPHDFLPVHVDGPYGAPSEDFYHYDRIIMIGAGIGVTPFISILKDIKYKWDRKAFGFDVKRAYFFWMVNDQESFSWFSDLLTELMDMDEASGIIKIRTYLTGALAHTDIRGFALWHILSLFYETQCVDAITGLPSRTYWGHPDWSDIFKSFKVVFRDRQIRRVGVFYCGPDGLATDIEKALKDASSSRLQFVWHKEKF